MIRPGEIYMSIGVVAAIVGLMWRVSATIHGVSKNGTEKRGEIYTELTKEKKEALNTFVSKEVCSIKSEQMHADIIEIKIDMKKLLSKNGIK